MKIHIKNLTKSFGDHTVLKDLSFSAKSGQALGLLGRNGAGKTTTIRIIMDVLKADQGEIIIEGKPSHGGDIKFGYLPEERGLYPKKKIKSQLLYLAELNGMSRKDALASIKALLTKLDMLQHLDVKLGTLSKGNQQKIQLVSVLMTKPDIVILDEPFSGLDPVNAISLKTIIKELIAEGKIVIFSSHQMVEIEEFCNDIAIINHGQIVLSGDLKTIKASYPKEYLHIKGKNLPALAELIKSQHHIRYKELNIQEETFKIHLSNTEEKQDILKLITDNNIEVEAFYVPEPSLNEIFIHTTTGGADDETVSSSI